LVFTVIVLLLLYVTVLCFIKVHEYASYTWILRSGCQLSLKYPLLCEERNSYRLGI